ncbi:hypothetical protein C5167_026051 [Papaver somniferum]|nr:hypothetical protein C5167_026051 [Papaver somniferum]
MATNFMDEEIPIVVSRQDFPPNFVFGVSTSAYQVEGAVNEGGRGESIWDVFARKEGKIVDGSNGDIAADQYHRYKEDVELMSKLGFDAYRFSVSWPRIFPDGLGTKVNEEGIAYYNNLIDALLDKGMQPYLTLYHWDLPNYLQESIGGWLSDEIVKYFAIYAETCFANFGDRVKHWITLNELCSTSVHGYDVGTHAPGEVKILLQNLIWLHTINFWLMQRLFPFTKTSFRLSFRYVLAQQGGEIGIALDCEWAEAFPGKEEDKNAAARR